MNYQKLTNITDLGLVYLRLNIDTAGDLYEILKSTKNKCIWGKKLMKYGFAFKGIRLFFLNYRELNNEYIFYNFRCVL